jgi:hypothetical protein
MAEDDQCVFHLAWKIALDVDVKKPDSYMVDAQNGKILLKYYNILWE